MAAVFKSMFRPSAFVMSKANYEKFVIPSRTLGRPGKAVDGKGQFVTDSRPLLKVIDSYKGELPKHLEQKLGLNDGSLGDHPVMGFIYETGMHNPDLPQANNEGSNAYFKEGGATSGGLPEAVIDSVSTDRLIYMPFDQEGLVEAAHVRVFDVQEFRKLSPLAKWLQNHMKHDVEE